MDARALVLVRRMAVVAMALGLVIAGPAAGEKINLQARLTDAQGQPITVQTAVRLSIYRGGTANQAGTGTLVYDEAPVNVTPDAAGVFNYLLGTTPATGTLDGALFASSEPFFLEVKIGTTALLPRQSIVFGARALTAIGLTQFDGQGRRITNAEVFARGSAIWHYDPETGKAVSYTGISNGNFGFVATMGPNEATTVFMASTTGNGDGIVQVNDRTGAGKITLNGATGDITKTGTNGFRIDHPDDPARRWLTYISLEGPETGIYFRGTERLVNGEADVALPHHFGLVASPAGMTVQLTPRSAESEGLAVIELTPERLRVKELRRGTGSYEFDYLVQAVRKGYEGFDPESDKAADKAAATAPTSETR